MPSLIFKKYWAIEWNRRFQRRLVGARQSRQYRTIEGNLRGLADEVINLADARGLTDRLAPFADHPHLHGRSDPSNTLYLAAERLQVPHLHHPGAGVFNEVSVARILTDVRQSKRSTWKLPEWFHPQHGATLADTIRLIYRLALEGDGTSGPMGVKNITAHLNRHRLFTRDGGRWGIGQVHRILTRRTYIGEHEFNKRSKAKALKPVSEIVTVAVPPIIDQTTFDAVQAHLRSRNPKVTPARVVSGPTLLTGICFCADCGGAMTLRTGKGGRYRYYTCSIKARQGETGCKGRSIPMEKLDNLVASHIEDRLLQPERLEEVLAAVLDRRQERSERRREHIAELNKRATETDLRLKRLYDAIESGVADLGDTALRDRIAGLKATRDQARADSERAQAMLESSGQQAITPQMVRKFARTARERMRIEGGGYRRDHLRALAQRVEVADKEVRIMGSKGDLLRTLAAGAGVAPATPGVRSSVLKWRRGRDSNPRYGCPYAAFRVRCDRPLCHLSGSRAGRRI
jgi:site-specific DNA recombinase